MDVIPWQSLYKNVGLPLIESPGGNNYQIVDYVGEGTFGAIFKVVNLKDDMTYVAKLYKKRTDNTAFNREKTAYASLSSNPTCSPYIVCMKEAFTTSLTIKGREVVTNILIIEYMDGGDVDSRGVPPQDVNFFVKTTLDGLQAIFDQGYTHRDLKPANILYSVTNDQYKIGDLGGICKAYENNTDGLVNDCKFIGTPLVMSPRAMHLRGKFSTLVQAQQDDIWALGMTYYLLFFRDPYPDDYTEDDIARINQREVNGWLSMNLVYRHGEPDGIAVSSLIGLIRRMLRVDPNQQWTLSELIDYWERCSFRYRDHIVFDYINAEGDCEVENRIGRASDLAEYLHRLAQLVVEKSYDRIRSLNGDSVDFDAYDRDINNHIEVIQGLLNLGCISYDRLRDCLRYYWGCLEDALNAGVRDDRVISKMDVDELTAQYLSNVLILLTPP